MFEKLEFIIEHGKTDFWRDENRVFHLERMQVRTFSFWKAIYLFIKLNLFMNPEDLTTKKMPKEIKIIHKPEFIIEYDYLVVLKQRYRTCSLGKAMCYFVKLHLLSWYKKCLLKEKYPPGLRFLIRHWIFCLIGLKNNIAFIEFERYEDNLMNFKPPLTRKRLEWLKNCDISKEEAEKFDSIGIDKSLHWMNNTKI